jgi:hypothetical protein
MGWVKYSLVAFGLIFIIVTVVNLVQTGKRLTTVNVFNVANENTDSGIFDPTLAFDPTGDMGLAAYSGVSRATKETLFPSVSVNLAYTRNKGRRWVFNSNLFSARSDNLTIDGKTVSGVWRYEMPSLVYMPEDTGREWKIFAYRYFWADDIELARKTSVIVYKDSADPLKGWSEEKWLFSANQFNPPAPYNRLVLLHINVLDPALADVRSYADPGAHVKDGLLYVSLSAFETITDPARIIMVSSADAGKSWSYIGNILTIEDVEALEYLRMIGGQIFEFEGESYFLVTLGDKLQAGQGAFVMKFADLSKGQLERDKNGKPVIYNHFALDENVSSSLGGGQADYHAMNESGLLMAVMLARKVQKPFVILAQGHDIVK